MAANLTCVLDSDTSLALDVGALLVSSHDNSLASSLDCLNSEVSRTRDGPARDTKALACAFGTAPGAAFALDLATHTRIWSAGDADCLAVPIEFLLKDLPQVRDWASEPVGADLAIHRITATRKDPDDHAVTRPFYYRAHVVKDTRTTLAVSVQDVTETVLAVRLDELPPPPEPDPPRSSL